MLLLPSQAKGFIGTQAGIEEHAHRSPASPLECAETLLRGKGKQCTTTGTVCKQLDQPDARRALSFHFATFTPFTMSHRQSDNSPIRASPRMRKIVPA